MIYILLLLVSTLVCAVSIPPIIRIAMTKRLFDVPLEARKVHKRLVPNLGGLGIILGVLFAYSLVADAHLFPNAGVILAASLVISIIGLKDDLVGITPYKKFAAQFMAAFLVSVLADMRITHLFGIFGIDELSYFPSVLLTIFTIVGIINAFNLIDGIDGLAGGIALVVSATYAILFYISDDLGWSYLACALAGASIGFLIYNISPAKIFMGDTGALFIGFIVSLFSVRLLNTNYVKNDLLDITINTQIAPALSIAILIIPLFDTLRVFTIRILNSESPFKADRNHIHHKLLDIGFSHTKATISLVSCNIFFIALVLFLQDIGNSQLMLTLVISVLLTNTALTLYVNHKREKLNKDRFGTNSKSDEMTMKKDLLSDVLEKIIHN